MRKLILFATFSALGATSALAADPTGDWLVADAVAHIRVAECNGNMWGAVAWEKEPGGIDEHNPDVSKRSRPTLGIAVLINMKKKPGVDQWEGQVYNANDGKTYSSTIKPVGSDKLEIQGCVLGFLCGGETWTRIAGPIPSSPTNNVAKGARDSSSSSSAENDGDDGGGAQNSGSEAGIHNSCGPRRRRRYLPTPRRRAVCPLTPAETAALRRVS